MRMKIKRLMRFFHKIKFGLLLFVLILCFNISFAFYYLFINHYLFVMQAIHGFESVVLFLYPPQWRILIFICATFALLTIFLFGWLFVCNFFLKKRKHRRFKNYIPILLLCALLLVGLKIFIIFPFILCDIQYPLPLDERTFLPFKSIISLTTLAVFIFILIYSRGSLRYAYLILKKNYPIRRVRTGFIVILLNVFILLYFPGFAHRIYKTDFMYQYFENYKSYLKTNYGLDVLSKENFLWILKQRKIYTLIEWRAQNFKSGRTFEYIDYHFEKFLPNSKYYSIQGIGGILNENLDFLHCQIQRLSITIPQNENAIIKINHKKKIIKIEAIRRSRIKVNIVADYDNITHSIFSSLDSLIEQIDSIKIYELIIKNDQHNNLEELYNLISKLKENVHFVNFAISPDGGECLPKYVTQKQMKILLPIAKPKNRNYIKCNANYNMQEFIESVDDAISQNKKELILFPE